MTPRIQSEFGMKTGHLTEVMTRRSQLTLLTFRVAVLLFTLLTFASFAQGAWYNNDWDYRKKITIDRTKVAGALTNFPVLISLASDTDLATYAQDDGDDIVFTSSDGTTKLDHEIESFNGTKGQLIAWVKIPSLSNTAGTDIYMCYGYAGATNQQNVTRVWNDNGGTATNYGGVWHMNQTSGTTISDSASSANALGYRGGAGAKVVPEA